MSTLSSADFLAFFKAVNGHDPFPWQQRLADEVCERSVWPGLIGLPTGAGKTAVLDIAIFHLACEAARRSERTAPMRILFVVDRRVVVDEAYRRARRISRAIENAETGVLAAVADQLRLLAGDGAPPLDAVRLRGGVPQERDWARSPAQPLIAVSTVDQVGSRLLFRGYGVSASMAPVHAALVGSDALWLLDEVQLSQPLAQTLDRLVEGHAQPGGLLAQRSRLAPFGVVRLSATPSRVRVEPFSLAPADRRDDRLEARLVARKLAVLETVPEDDLASIFARHALRAIASGAKTLRTRSRAPRLAPPSESDRPAARVLVVLNTVDLAREVHAKLRAEVDTHAVAADVMLLTGRVRPLDRDRLIAEIARLGMFAAPDRPRAERAAVLVATQTIEAGADLDADALVTEIAPLDALRQRFGRVDRLGERGETRSVIVVPSRSATRWKRLERMYEGAAKATAEWLSDLAGEIDFGVDGFAPRLQELQREPELLDRLLSPQRDAPVLMPAYVELWAATAPFPPATPEPSFFLHGPETSADVDVVWRSDVELADPDTARTGLQWCPPSSLEALPVPVWEVRRWLLGEAEAGADVTERGDGESTESSAPAWRCMRREGNRWVPASAAEIRPGDLIVVPSGQGGCDAYGWNPAERGDVLDLGAEAHYRQRLKGAIRISRATFANGGGDPSQWDKVLGAIRDHEDAADLADRLAVLPGLPDTWSMLAPAIRSRQPRSVVAKTADESSAAVLWSDIPLEPGLLGTTDEDEESAGFDAVTDREDSSRLGVEVPLLRHLAHVEQRARDFATRCGLPDSLIILLALAGKLHDLGKADPRFQAELRGMGALAARDPALATLLQATAGGLLAKSAQGARSRPAVSALPVNFRHEALSVALAERHPALGAMAVDDHDLLLWLVGTHHGRGRPFFPSTRDERPESLGRVDIDGATLIARADDAPLRLDQGWIERATRLLRSYGPWELARLEAIVRLADHAASAAEQQAAHGRSGVREAAGVPT